VVIAALLGTGAPAEAQTASADLSVALTASSTAVMSASNVTFTMTVANAGPNPAAKAKAAQAVPAGTTFVSSDSSQGTCKAPNANSIVICQLGRLARNGTATFALTVRTVTPGGGVLGLGQARSDTDDPDPSNNRANAPVQVTRQHADLALSLSASSASASTGETVRYTVDVVNNGPSTASKIDVVDTLPRGATFQALDTTATSPGLKCATPPVDATGRITCNLNNLRVNSSASLVFTAKVTAATGMLSNTALVQSTADDADLSNNTQTAEVLVAGTDAAKLPRADVAMDVLRDAHRVAPGDTLTYVVVVGNGGPGDASNVTFTNTIQPGTTFASVATDRGSCTNPAVGGNGLVRCAIGALADSQRAIITIAVNVVAPVNTIIGAKATVTQAERAVDPVPANNVSLWLTPVLEPKTTTLSREMDLIKDIGDSQADPRDLAAGRVPVDAAAVTIAPFEVPGSSEVVYAVKVENAKHNPGWTTRVAIDFARGTTLRTTTPLAGASCDPHRIRPDGSITVECTTSPLPMGSSVEVARFAVSVDETALVRTPLFSPYPTCRRDKVQNPLHEHEEVAWMHSCLNAAFAAAAIARIPFHPLDAVDINNVAPLCIIGNGPDGQALLDAQVRDTRLQLDSTQWSLRQSAMEFLHRAMNSPMVRLETVSLCSASIRMVPQKDRGAVALDLKMTP